MKSSRISRVIKTLTMLQSESGCNVGELAEHFGIAHRTIFRDLKELKAIGVSFHYSAKRRRYKINPEFFLPPIDLNLEEALSLLLSVHKTSKKMEMPFKNSALLAAMKIENNLPSSLREYCNTSMQNVSVQVTPQAPMKQLDITFWQLQKAIRRKQKVNLRYDSFFERRIIDIEFCPYYLLYKRRAWYVLGLSSLHEEIRTFKLNRIIQLHLSDKRFVMEKEFDLHEYLGRAWSIIKEGRLYNIKLHFLPKVAGNVAEVR